MRLLFDKGEARLILEHVRALLVPGFEPSIPDTYGDIQVGDLAEWDSDSLNLLLDEGRRRLDSVNHQFESIRSRSQYLLATSLAAAGALAGLIDHIVDGVAAFLLWVLGMVAYLVALLLSFATFASTARLGSVDPVLLSRHDGQDTVELTRSLARAYTQAVRRSTTAVHVRFTLYRDAIWFLVIGTVLGVLGWLLGGANA